MSGTYIDLVPDAVQAAVLEDTRVRLRTAAQESWKLAKPRGATRMSQVLGLATRSLAGLPDDLARGVAASVAAEVAGRGAGPEKSAVLGIKCVKQRANGRVSILTTVGKRIKVSLAPSQAETLQGLTLRGPVYLVATDHGPSLFVPDSSLPATKSPSAAGAPTSNLSEPYLCPDCGSVLDGHPSQETHETEYLCDTCGKDVTISDASPPRRTGEPEVTDLGAVNGH